MKQRILTNYFFLIPVVLLLIIQVPNLALPYFWDESWSYMTAILKMAESGPSLLPGTIPIDYCKGHPQFFFFVSSLWMNLHPESIVFMRILPLLISVGVLLVIFFGLRKLANPTTANIGVLLVGVQSTFLAQSILVLPEMLLLFFFLISFFAFLNRKYLVYAVASSLMVLTKETATVYALIFGFYFIILMLKKSERFSPGAFLFIGMPGIVYGLFLLVHYLKFGVFFYQDHLNFIHFNPGFVLRQIGSAFTTAFTHYGRILIVLITILSLLFILVLKRGIQNTKALILGMSSLIAYLVFTGFNFYSPRYTLSLTVLLILIFALIFSQLPVNSYIKSSIVGLISVVCLYYSLNIKRDIDIDLGYVEVIKVHQEMVEYCEQNNFFNESIAASFNLYFELRDSRLGYNVSGKSFTNVRGLDRYSDSKYFMYETTAGNDPNGLVANSKFKLVKAFTNKHAWGFIYENPNPEKATLHDQPHVSAVLSQ
jgi:hypothetical protein